MATLSSTLAWKIPWLEEPGELQSMGLQRTTSFSLQSVLLLLFAYICILGLTPFQT